MPLLILIIMSMLVVHAANAACTTPKDPFVNPFNAKSAHHRPIGTGAVYQQPKTWKQARSIGINTGAPWGVSVAETNDGDPLRTIRAGDPKCNKIVGFPRSIRLPREGFVTPVKMTDRGCTDGVVVIYDRPTNAPHQIRQYNWNGGKPSGGQYKTWDIDGLGHGTEPGERLGTSASGVAAMFGLLRGDEINNTGRKVEHALQMILPRRGDQCANMLSRQAVLPAVGGDGSMNSPGNNLGDIPYGALMALPPVSKGGPDINKMGLTERGKRLVQAIRDYGVYAVDGGSCLSIRADQHVKNTAELKAALSKIYPHMKRVMNNNVLGQPTAGGGTPLADNCARG